MLYNNIESTVINKGNTSDHLKLEKGSESDAQNTIIKIEKKVAWNLCKTKCLIRRFKYIHSNSILELNCILVHPTCQSEADCMMTNKIYYTIVN